MGEPEEEIVWSVGKVYVRLVNLTEGHAETCACHLCTMLHAVELAHDHAMALDADEPFISSN